MESVDFPTHDIPQRSPQILFVFREAYNLPNKEEYKIDYTLKTAITLCPKSITEKGAKGTFESWPQCIEFKE